MATRQLCAIVQVNPAIACLVMTHLDDKLAIAWRPYPGIDHVTLTDHAVEAGARWRKLEDRLKILAILLAILLMALVLAATFLGAAATAVPLLLLGCAAAVGWWLTYETLKLSRARAVALLRARSNASLAPDDQAAGDADADASNTVIFSATAKTPFTGSGYRAASLVMPPIDIGQGKPTPAGDRGLPVPFTVSELHEHFATGTKGKLAIDNVHVQNRLFVRGDAVKHIDGLLPRRDEPPLDRVDQHWILAGAARPTDRARTYLCLEKQLAGGQVVVTLHVRFMLQRHQLSLEIAAHVLPPINPYATLIPGVTDAFFDMQLRPVKERSVARATAAAARRMLGSYLTMQSGRWSGAKVLSAYQDRLRSQEELMREGLYDDYGATSNLRELMAVPNVDDYLHAVDVEDCLRRMERGVLDILEEFLDAHEIDTSELTQRQEQIVGNLTYNIASISGSGHHIGGGGKVTNLSTTSDTDRARPVRPTPQRHRPSGG